MCAPKGNEAPAGEVSAMRDAKQQESVVQEEENKACNGSSPGTAAGAGAQCSGSTNTKNPGSPGSDQMRRDKSECASMCSDKSLAGAVSATSGAKQRIGKGCGNKAQQIPKTKEAEEAGSRHSSLLNAPGPCYNCGGPHHNHRCPGDCIRCGDGPPCQCKCWRWRQWKKRSSIESSVVPTVITISDYMESRSCSKKKAYQALSDFVKARTYIWQLVHSPDFTAKVESDLRCLLLAMRDEDRSGLYRRACTYYGKFKTDPLDLTNLRK